MVMGNGNMKKKTLSDNLDINDPFALMIISAQADSHADLVIFRCPPSRVRLTPATGAMSNNFMFCFGGLFWLIKTTNTDLPLA